MKAIAIPKELGTLTEQVKAQTEALATIRADIERAREAAGAADRLEGEIDALSNQRAERKAQAFISRQPADLAELDKQMEKLDRATRVAREDGKAATLAIGLLTEKQAEVEQALAAASARRLELALAYLEQRRDHAIDQYVVAIDALGALVAEAAACDRARTSLGFYPRSVPPGEYLHQQLRGNHWGLPYQWHRKIPNSAYAIVNAKRDWQRDSALGDSEHAQLLADLAAAGVTP